MLTSVLPGAVPTGGEIASAAFVDALRSAGHRVVVVGYSRPGASPIGGEDMVPVGDRVIETSSARWARFAWMFRSVLGRQPYSVAKFESHEYARRTEEVLAMLGPDIVIVEHVQMMWVRWSVEWRMPTILNTQNVEHEMYQQLAALKAGTVTSVALRREARLMERWERASAARSTEIWTLTDDDASYFRAAAPGKQVRQFDLPATPDSAPAKDCCDIGIIGTWTWQPNRAGLEWFLAKVVPHLADKLIIRIAGRGGEWIERRAPGVSWAGLVPSAGAFLRSARVIAVPSVTGGGVQVKTLDAIAAGRPVVATSVALRGIRDIPDYVACVDDPAQFAASLNRALLNGDGSGRGDTAAVGLAWTRLRRERFTQAVGAAVAALVTAR
jgi:glycosyltransferase involved in cell wall biosynthesis